MVDIGQQALKASTAVCRAWKAAFLLLVSVSGKQTKTIKLV
jgi:hypothetical protein